MSAPAPTTTLDESVADSTKRDTKDTRLRWQPFTKTSLVKGEEVTTFPFLDDSNLKDLWLVRYLLAERPYKAGYGSTIKAWEEIAIQLRDQKHPETGELLYGPKGLRGKTLKDRFISMMEFVKQQDREVLRRTGTDDEPVPGEIMSALEDLYSDWQSHCAVGESKTQALAAQKKKDRDAAEALRQASLGNLSAIYGTDNVSDLDGDTVPALNTPASSRRLSYASSRTSSSRSRSPVSGGGQHSEALQDLITRSQEREAARSSSKRARLEVEIKKEERDSRRLQMEEERLRLENERLQLDRVEREQIRAERTASIQLMQALAQTILNQNKNQDNNSTSK